METIKLDIDRETGSITPLHLPEYNVNRISEVMKFYQLDVRSIDIRHTNKGFHIRIGVTAHSIRRLSKGGIVFLQLAMGSDWKREIWNWYRFHNAYATKPSYSWNILFNYKHRLSDNYISKESNRCKICETLIADSLYNDIKPTLQNRVLRMIEH